MAVNYRFEITDDNTGEIIKATDEAIERALEALGQQAVGYAKMLTPVDTGNLRNSMTHQVDMEDKVVYVGTNVQYAPYVEFGTGLYADEGGRKTPWWYKDDKGNWHYTHGQKPAHFLRDAIEKHKDEYKRLAESMLKL